MVKTILKIEGMACSMCESHINDVVRSNFDVKKGTSSHTKGETVILSEAAPDSEILTAAIAKTGCTVKDIRTEEAEEKHGFFSKFKK